MFGNWKRNLKHKEGTFREDVLKLQDNIEKCCMLFFDNHPADI